MTNFFEFSEEFFSRSKIDAARTWIKRGFRVLVVHGVRKDGACTCGSALCDRIGKHPRAEFPHGYKGATRQVGKIRRVLRRNPEANIAVVPTDGVVVLDADGPEGLKTLKELGLPPTATVGTGRGVHAYFRFAGEIPEKLPRLHCVDIKARRGYVIVPPSRHRSGKTYLWNKGGVLKIAELPPDFFRRLSGRLTVNFSGISAQAREGQRNSTLTSYAGYFRYRSFSPAQIVRVLKVLNSEVCKPALSDSEVESIATSVGRYETPQSQAFGTMSDVKALPILWLYGPYFPRCAVTVIEGNPGVGKSTFISALASAVSAGKSVPFSTDIANGNVLLLSAEDDPARILQPRLTHCGANLSRIRFQQSPFSLGPKGIEMVRAEMLEHHPHLVVIDPLIAYMDTQTEVNDAGDATHFMSELDTLAREFEAAIVVVRHFRKAAVEDPSHRGLGSIAISARVRSGLILGPHPQNEDERVAVPYKNNYAEKGPAILYRLISFGKNAPPGVKWLGTDETLTVDDVLRPTNAKRGRPESEGPFAESFLREYLSKGPRKKVAIDLASEARGISRATLRRAAKTVGVVKKRIAGTSYWALPEPTA